MIHYTCDLCGKRLDRGKLRYIARVEVFAAYDTLEIRREDLERDLEFEIREALERLKEEDPRKLLEDVYRNFQFDLCDGCRESYVKDPLAGIQR